MRFGNFHDLIRNCDCDGNKISRPTFGNMNGNGIIATWEWESVSSSINRHCCFVISITSIKQAAAVACLLQLLISLVDTIRNVGLGATSSEKVNLAIRRTRLKVNLYPVITC